MIYCNKCGSKLEENVKFCSHCGCKVVNEGFQGEDNKKTIYEGVVHKCINCGEMLPSFVIKCPSCGSEIRNIKSSYVIEEFSKKISETLDDSITIQVIRTFPIPNTKEDIFEFLVMAKSNIKRYDKNGDGLISELEEELVNAWLTKADQCLEKARILMANSKDLEIFEKAREEIELVVFEISNKKQRIKNKELSCFLNKEFKESKIAKIIIYIGLIISFYRTISSFANGNILSGVLSLISLVLFISSFLIGCQIIKVRIRYIYILPLVLGFIFICPSFNLSDYGDKQETYERDDIKLVNYFPEFENLTGHISINSLDEIYIYNIDCTERQFYDYVTKCKDEGYNYEIMDEDNNSFYAFNSEGYKIMLSFYNSLSINIEKPIEMVNIIWPSTDLSKILVDPNKNKGLIIKNTNEELIIYLSDFTKEEYFEYIQKCKNIEGIEYDDSSNDNNFSGRIIKKSFLGINKKEYELNVDYIGYNTVYIIIKTKS